MEVYFDNAATTAICPEALSAMNRVMTEAYGNPSSMHSKGREAKKTLDTAREQVAKYQGMIMDALVEEVNEHDATLLTGRLSNNTLVHFPGDPSLIGKIVDVTI